MIKLKDEPLQVIKRLNQHNFKAYLVGGCLRDYLLGTTPQDFDIATDAKPEDVMKLFEKTIPTGIKHGTVTVIINNVKIEVTTFRIEKEYQNHRWPTVEFTDSLYEDLKRRDFTINALAYHPDEGLIDYFNGLDDLKNKIVRCVGNPHERFFEDALRILRCIRFATQLNFSIDEKTFEGVVLLKDLLKKISKERINAELSKILRSKNSLYGIKLLYESGVGETVIPEYIKIYSFLHSTEFDLILSEFKIPAFFACFRDPKKVEDIMRDLRFDKKNIILATKLCNYLNSEYATEYLVKKVYFEEEKMPEGIISTLSILKKDKTLMELFSTLKAQNKLVSKKDVKIKGDDLLKLGLKGKELGNVLQIIYEYILHNPEKNNRDEILKHVNSYFKQGKN
ncbi:tRNA adenylyltransferase [Caldicellulosiruptor saccharolyticus DSM 8903]|uniref:tRNA adenylyltransferase n=1 Tax=Caldicellulosiruptor saccharolyticus (strain ATCC 43494 / DSM 8903 / Tp8T 6331) TaxID=351627 RepID=A4XLP3_CALS8|nr:CCA tRNA nucleotidyltransferase [Caldicellulosiruptor saccharolyticus]ABP67828.1 tRNA adenylyltransferase [Caldicellulosiruptor saccharolyticus DSM 8903]